jgi:clan AA aspartic protease (TIGR02281 family)
LLAGNELLISIALPAGQTSALDLPIGTYQWRLRHGAAWCSRQQQFVREVQTNVARPLEIVASSRLTIQMDDDANHPSGLRLKTSDEPVVSVSGRGAVTAHATMRPDGVYVLRRSDSGHYLIEGSIDGITLQFMVDTGATMVAIPETLAHRLGHYRGREVVTQTANGPIAGFEFVAREILFGPFVANDVSVLALPNLPQPLLGMSLLGAMNLRQTPQGLALSAGR